VQEESVSRVRPPRCIYADKIIRPYILKEAQCVAILKVLNLFFQLETHIFFSKTFIKRI
jgi:hypothetical protein